MQEILQRRPVDGIFFYSDIMAIGAMRVLHREGISVPSDVKVIGFDNIAVAEHLPVSLTTVGQPVLEPVDAAISQIKTRLEDPDLARQFCRFETGLIIRESAPVGSELSREEIFSPKET